MARSDVLADARFELAHAHVAWPDGSESEGWGRDADLQLAGLKAAAEAVERHACARLPATAMEARAAALAAWMAPQAIVRYESSQQLPFACFDPAQLRWWVPATRVDDARQHHVLADCVCLPEAFAAPYRARLVTWATSSGCATGSSLADAIGRATLELVERDAFLRHWLRQEPGHALRVDSLPGWAAQRIAALRERGCLAGLQWLGLGVVPVLLAWAQHRRQWFTCVGAGCAFDAEEALATALNELETPALARIDGVPEVEIAPAAVRGPADHGALYATRAHFRDADAVLAPDAGETRSFDEVAMALPRDAGELYALLHERGHPVCWVDLTVPAAANLVDGLPLHTVRALAPGLVPMAFGHGLLPLGMLDSIHPGGRRVHPFC